MAQYMVSPGDVLLGEVTKSGNNEDAGLKVVERNGKLWVVGVRRDGLFWRYTPVIPGDQVLQVNGKSAINASTCLRDGLDAEDVSKILQDEPHIEIKLRRAVQGEYGDY